MSTSYNHLAKIELEVKVYRKRYYIYAGVARLSRGFATQELADKEVEKNGDIYEYWAQSSSVIDQNRVANGQVKEIVAG